MDAVRGAFSRAAANYSAISKRYVTAALICVGFVLIRGMGIDWPSTLIYTVTFNSTHQENLKTQFNWDTYSIQLCYQSYLWAYLVSMATAGFLTCIYPAHKMFGIAISVTAIIQLFVPLIIDKTDLAIFWNFLSGLFEGLTYPTFLAMMRFWAPPMENTILVVIGLFGFFIGEFASQELVRLELASLISSSTSCYAYGTLGVIWFIMWYWLSHEKPSTHTAICGNELAHIRSSIGNASDNTRIHIQKIPWRKLLLSKPLYAIMAAIFCCGWNYWLLTSLVKVVYFKLYGAQLGFDASRLCLITLPTVMLLPFIAVTCDYLRQKHFVSTALLRKLFISGGLILFAIELPIIGYFKTDIEDLHYLFYGVLYALNAVALSGLITNQLDIAQHYAGLVMGLNGAVLTLATIVHSTAMDSIMTHKACYRLPDFRICIPPLRELVLVTIIINILGGVFYATFALGEKQSWARSQIAETSDESIVIDGVDDGNQNFILLRSPEESVDELGH